ncbi:MAG: nucleotidyltransferase domain-containing protein [Candidatus Omnitrophica bacterium]|nr:nucleotidyltransferase domain-containing protein [Candidatus Omnitrophota bacterium]
MNRIKFSLGGKLTSLLLAMALLHTPAVCMGRDDSLRPQAKVEKGISPRAAKELHQNIRFVTTDELICGIQEAIRYAAEETGFDIHKITVLLFGSYAAGRQTEMSDTDIAIIRPKGHAQREDLDELYKVIRMRLRDLKYPRVAFAPVDPLSVGEVKEFWKRGEFFIRNKRLWLITADSAVHMDHADVIGEAADKAAMSSVLRPRATGERDMSRTAREDTFGSEGRPRAAGEKSQTAQRPTAVLRAFENQAIEELSRDEKALDEINARARSEFNMLVIPAFSKETIAEPSEDFPGLIVIHRPKAAVMAQALAQEFFEDFFRQIRLYNLDAVSINVYELCDNVVRYGGGGIVTLRKIYSRSGEPIGFEIVQRDRGKGIDNIELKRKKAFRNGPYGHGRMLRGICDSIFARSSTGEIEIETKNLSTDYVYVYDKTTGTFKPLPGRKSAFEKGTRISLRWVKPEPATIGERLKSEMVPELKSGLSFNQV